MTDLQWQPAHGYGVCFVAVASGLIFETYKMKSGFYGFTAKRIGSGKEAPKVIYDSRTDVFVEKTQNPLRIKDVAVRWLAIREGAR